MTDKYYTQTIYKIENILTGDCYIGRTVKLPEDRWREHRRELRQQKHRNSKLQVAWLKYGEESFYFSILETGNLPYDREHNYFKILEPTYNLVAPPQQKLASKRPTLNIEEVKNPLLKKLLGIAEV